MPLITFVNSSPDMSPHDEVICGAGLNNGRVYVSSMMEPRAFELTSSKMVLAFTPSAERVKPEVSLGVKGIITTYCSRCINP